MTGGDYLLAGGFWPSTYICIVHLPDFAYFAAQWLATGPGLEADFYPDASIDLLDLAYLASYWLNACPGNWPW